MEEIHTKDLVPGTMLFDDRYLTWIISVEPDETEVSQQCVEVVMLQYNRILKHEQIVRETYPLTMIWATVKGIIK